MISQKLEKKKSYDSENTRQQGFRVPLDIDAELAMLAKEDPRFKKSRTAALFYYYRLGRQVEVDPSNIPLNLDNSRIFLSRTIDFLLEHGVVQQ